MLPCAVLGGVLMAACQVLIYRYAPVEQTMGLVQKIFYTHLPLAWWSFVSFFLVCVSGAAGAPVDVSASDFTDVEDDGELPF